MNAIPYVSISYCFNPGCLEPRNQEAELFCHACGADLRLQERYRGLGVLGQGGFGRTFWAIEHSQTPPIRCVIKQFWSESSAFQQTKSLFQQEVQRLSELGHHPQIPALFDSFEQNGLLYLVQEYIEGENLATALASRGKFSIAEIWQILESLLPVLQFIHSRGVIHRDIKPENVIRGQGKGVRGQVSGVRNEKADSCGLMADSCLFLVDFGAAKLLTETPLGQTGTVIGSPEYAAPEQVKGKAVLASDLYSLGVTCIHLLTGIRPFDLFDFSTNQWIWRNCWLTGAAHFTDDALRLAEVLDRLIEPALSQRFASAASAIAHIQRIRGKRIVMPAPPPPPPLWECYATLIGHRGLFARVNAIAINSEAQLIASASDDKTVRVWDIQTGTEQFVLQGHSQFVKSVASHPQIPTLLASGGSDRLIKLWDLQEQREIRTLVGHKHTINALAFSPDGTLLASGSSDKTINLWNPSTDDLITTLSGHTLAVNALAFTPSVQVKPQTSNLKPQTSLPHTPHPTPHTPLLASASTDSRIQIWDLSTFQSICTLSGHTAAVRAIAFSPDGNLLATAGEDRTIRLWDTTTWECMRTLSGHPWSISALTFSPAEDVLISGSWDKTVKLWDVGTGKEMTALVNHTDSVSCVAIAPDGTVIASGSQDKTIKLWRKAKG
ncbi:serine/threonine protein kinase [Kovacikia minuta CCNUW1]|uniref:serine/threonine-protein kinase n=1 Tax=Kovacikia minuta TaxID=2931930 RepID=UPI001CCB7ABD|nr:serine/threonine-protein kinase [Kovacikia minuta]UBF26078.1 serine/threonine protein kinase [Kovacikia minuta CCNUW1]